MKNGHEIHIVLLTVPVHYWTNYGELYFQEVSELKKQTVRSKLELERFKSCRQYENSSECLLIRTRLLLYGGQPVACAIVGLDCNLSSSWFRLIVMRIKETHPWDLSFGFLQFTLC